MSLGRSSFSCWNWQKFNTQKQRVKILTRYLLYLLFVIGYWLFGKTYGEIGFLKKNRDFSHFIGFYSQFRQFVCVSYSFGYCFESFCALWQNFSYNQNRIAIV